MTTPHEAFLTIAGALIVFGAIHTLVMVAIFRRGAR